MEYSSASSGTTPGGRSRGLPATVAPSSALASTYPTDAIPSARVRTDLGSNEADHAGHQIQRFSSSETTFTTTLRTDDNHNSIFDSDSIRTILSTIVARAFCNSMTQPFLS